MRVLLQTGDCVQRSEAEMRSLNCVFSSDFHCSHKARVGSASASAKGWEKGAGLLEATSRSTDIPAWLLIKLAIRRQMIL